MWDPSWWVALSLIHIYLNWLGGATGGYYNFSGENDITRNKNYYYEGSHYTEVVGDMIIDRIFNGKRDGTLESQGFGLYVTYDLSLIHI